METINDIVLSCVRKSGISEDDLLAAYERKCRRKRIVALYGQVRTALVELHRQRKIYVKTVGDHKLCFKR